VVCLIGTMLLEEDDECEVDHRYLARERCGGRPSPNPSCWRERYPSGWYQHVKIADVDVNRLLVAQWGRHVKLTISGLQRQQIRDKTGIKWGLTAWDMGGIMLKQ
jgi:hypothetical protein